MTTTHVLRLAAFLLISTIARAEEPLKIPQLLEFEDVEIHEVHPDSITVLHKKGGATIPYERLPKELQSDLGFDRKTAEAYRAEVEALRLEKEEIARGIVEEKVLEDLLLPVKLSGKVLRRVEGGVILQNVTYQDGQTEPVVREREIRSGGPTTFHPNREYTINHVEETIAVPIDHPLSFAFVEMPNEARPALEKAFLQTAYSKGYYETRDGIGRDVTMSAFTLSRDDALAYLRALETGE